MPNHDRFECQTVIDSDAILQNERGVTLSFEQVPYATLLRWLEILNKEYGIQVVAISIVTGTGPTGSVSVPLLTLR